jgi:hypothetical protein
MASQRYDEIIEVLDCDFGVRPKGAPGVDRLLPHVRGLSRAAGALLVEFDERASEALAAFVEAERLCCAGIGWEIERLPALRLRISAGDEQLRAIESLWSGSIESHR